MVSNAWRYFATHKFFTRGEDENLDLWFGAGTSDASVSADGIGGVFQAILWLRGCSDASCDHAGDDKNERRSSGPGTARCFADERRRWPIRLRLCHKGIPETVVGRSSGIEISGPPQHPTPPVLVAGGARPCKAVQRYPISNSRGLTCLRRVHTHLVHRTIYLLPLDKLSHYTGQPRKSLVLARFSGVMEGHEPCLG